MRLTAAVVAALVAAACGRGEPAPDPVPAPAPEAAAERPDATSTGGRRGDRHARAAARRSPKVKRIEGTLSKADERRVVIRAPGEAPVTLRVAPSTTVTVGGRPTRIDALREGAEVRASYRTGGGGRPTAIAIEARERPEPERAEPEPPPPSDG